MHPPTRAHPWMRKIQSARIDILQYCLDWVKRRGPRDTPDGSMLSTLRIIRAFRQAQPRLSWPIRVSILKRKPVLLSLIYAQLNTYQTWYKRTTLFQVNEPGSSPCALKCFVCALQISHLKLRFPSIKISALTRFWTQNSNRKRVAVKPNETMLCECR